MNFLISIYSTELNQLSFKQVFRYMGMHAVQENDKLMELVRQTYSSFLKSVHCKGCYVTVPVEIHGNMLDFGLFKAESTHLARSLGGCEHAVLFAATLGIEADRQRIRAAANSPAKALVLDAMGSAAIEQFCDELSSEISSHYPSYRLRPRFSPGYGDLALDVQKQLLSILDAQRRIGVTMTDGGLMVPQKSVTAIMGFAKIGCTRNIPDCENCDETACEFRR